MCAFHGPCLAPAPCSPESNSKLDLTWVKSRVARVRLRGVIVLLSPSKVAQAAGKKRGPTAGDVVTPLPVELPLEHAPRLRHGHAVVLGVLPRECSSR